MLRTMFIAATLGLLFLIAVAAHAVADLPSVIALDGAAGSPPRVVLVLVTGPADTLAVTAWLSAADTTTVAVNAAKLQRTPTGVKGEITFSKSGTKPISCSYRLEGTVADGVLTGSYTGMEGDVTVTGTLRWGMDALPLGHALFTPSSAHPVGWMGDLSGRYSGARDFPLEWDTTTGKNILWKSQLPIGGHSSPIVVGRKVFLTCEPDLTVCLDADTGAILWQHAGDGLRKGSSGIYHYSTGYSMGTICSDGANLFVTHYNGVVMSYDLDGNVRWRKDVPALGWSGASPCMLDGKFIVIQGNGTHERRGPYDLVAYSCTDGAVVWNTSAVIKQSGWHYNGITPMWVAGTPYVVNFTGQFFNARNGRLVAQLFSDAGPQWVPAVEGNTVVLTRQLMRTDKWREGMLDLAKVDLPEPMGMAEALQRDKTLLVGKVPRGLASGSHSQHDALVVALTAASDGKDGLLFTPRQKPILILDRAGATTASLLAGDIFYHVGESGMNVLDLATGASLNPGGYDGMEIKPSRPAPRGLFGGSGLLYSAPVFAGEYLTVSDWGGRTHVFNRAPELRELSVNLTECLQKPPAGNPISGPAGGLASSEFYSGNRIYFRHWDALYCIGDPQA
ncbi:MAG: PQQ-binding-like beta-propeller repeat protein, partial [bacterium]